MRRSTPARLTAWAAVGFFSFGFAWIVGLAPFTGIDEFDHGYRAVSVAAGHWRAGGPTAPPELARGDLIRVRGDVVKAASAACNRLPYTRAYNCRAYQDPPGNEVVVASSAGRYNPVYYWIVGTAAKPFRGDAALSALRLAGLLMCTALFAAAVRASLIGARTIWPMTAVLVAGLPTTVYSAALSAPNGTEMLAGLAVWSTLLALTTRRERPGWLYASGAVAAALLISLHTLGLFWLGLILVAIALLSGVRRTLGALRPRSALDLGAAVLVAAVSVFEVAWVVLARTNAVPSKTVAMLHSVWSLLPREMMLWPLQAIGAYPFRDEPAPLPVYGLVIALVLGILLAARPALRTERRLRRCLGFVVLCSFAIPAAATVLTYDRLGMTWQGRYGMPFTFGFFLLVGLALDRRPPPRHVPTGVFVLFSGCWALAQALGPISVSLRQRHNVGLVNASGWNPPSLLLLAALAAVGGLCYLVALSNLQTKLVGDAPGIAGEAPVLERVPEPGPAR